MFFEHIYQLEDSLDKIMKFKITNKSLKLDGKEYTIVRYDMGTPCHTVRSAGFICSPNIPISIQGPIILNFQVLGTVEKRFSTFEFQGITYSVENIVVDAIGNSVFFIKGGIEVHLCEYGGTTFT